MDGRIDLHTHSNRSDGTYTPRDLARLAKSVGLCAVALTDHDTMDGVAEFSDECNKLGIEGIPGVEFSAKYHRELHILGLYPHGKKLDKVLEKLRISRGERNIKMLARLSEYGIDITERDLTDQAGGISLCSAGRVHMANAMLAKGYIEKRSDAFKKYLGKNSPCYVERFSLTAEEFIRLIKESGGIAIWAHAAWAADSEKELCDKARQFADTGLDGIECLYSKYTAEETDMCFRVAEKLGILPSGGSDFHGMNKPSIKLGTVSGGSGHVPYSMLENLRTEQV